jgi:hypothetical protein
VRECRRAFLDCCLTQKPGVDSLRGASRYRQRPNQTRTSGLLTEPEQDQLCQ